MSVTLAADIFNPFLLLLWLKIGSRSCCSITCYRFSTTDGKGALAQQFNKVNQNQIIIRYEPFSKAKLMLKSQEQQMGEKL